MVVMVVTFTTTGDHSGKVELEHFLNFSLADAMNAVELEKVLTRQWRNDSLIITAASLAAHTQT